MGYIKVLKEVAPSAPGANNVELYYDSTSLRWQLIDEFGGIYVLQQYENKYNYCINGGLDVVQRQTPGTLTSYALTNGRTMSADRWGLSPQTSSCQFQQIDTSAANESGLQARMYGKLKQITGAGKFVFSQVLENSMMMALRGRNVRVSCKMRYSVAASMTVRLCLLQLTNAGTVDTIPATFVSAYGVNGTDPTFGANISQINPTLTEANGSIANNGVTCILASTWARFSATFSVPTNAKNLILCVFSNSQLAINDEFNISEVGIYDGNDLMDWTPRLIQHELLVCQRYYCKTFTQGIVPAQNVGVNTGEFKWTAGIIAAAAERSPSFRYPVTMRITPATIVTANPGAANAQVRDETAAGDCSATTVVGANDSSLGITCTGNAATIVGGLLGVHLTLDAEL